MTVPAREQLLGYLLGALDDNEQADIEKILGSDATLRRELAILNRSLAPLDAAPREFYPPPGLASRTSAFVAASATAAKKAEGSQGSTLLATSVAAATATEPATRPNNSHKMKPVDSVCGNSSSVRWQDSIVAAGIMVAACGLLFPAIIGSREQARNMLCKDNLRGVYTALTDYSENHGGLFPKVPEKGNLAAAGMYAPQLLQDGYLTSPRQVICPGSELADDNDFTVPTIDELQSTTCPIQLAEMKRRMGGSYGYTLGHMNDGHYHGTKNLRRPDFAIASDEPNHALPSLQSRNHGGSGQNVLYEDGHVKFLPTTRPLGLSDDIFTNDNGVVAAGLHPNDAVIGSSPSAPVFNASMQ